MKRTLSALTAAVAALLLVVAAPALAYQPAPVEFSKPAGGSADSLETAKRFNVVGLRWRSRARPHVNLRVRQASGEWSRWRELPIGPGYTDAAWAGDANAVQYRVSRRVPGLRAHFVNTLGTTTAAARLKTAVRRIWDRPVRHRAAARGDAAQPQIVARSGWDPSNKCPPRSNPGLGQVKLAFVHHTVTLNDYAVEESPSIVLGICRYHRNNNGWSDVGYNFLVDKYGTIFEGRAGGIDRPVVGAQAQGFNSQSTGIANLGDHSSTPQSSPALQAMARLIRWKLPLEGAPTSGTVRVTSAGGSTNRYPSGSTATLNRISGHRDGNSTECPGAALYDQLPGLRRMVGSSEPLPPPGTPPPADQPASTRLTVVVSPAVVKVPGSSVVSGRLLTAEGQPVADQPVAIESLSRGAWRLAAGATTDASGSFSPAMAPAANQVLRARFAGVPAYRRSTSPRTRLDVRPDMTLKALPSRGSVRLRGGIAPHKRFVSVALERRSGGRYLRVATKSVAVSARGRWGVTIRGTRRGARYRAVAGFAGDSMNVANRSPRVYFRGR